MLVKSEGQDEEYEAETGKIIIAVKDNFNL